MHPLLNIAIAAARQAGDIIVRHFDQIERLQISEKHNEELFSEVDIKAEQAIINSILKAYPDHGILAEESGTQNTDSDSLWIIDPLDGTTNYLHGFPFFCVSIAYKFKNRIEHSVVYDPIRHECFTASRGRGAQLNDRRIRVSKHTQLQTSLLGSGVPFRSSSCTKQYMATLESLMSQNASIRRTGSAALDLAYVAAGRTDGYWGFGLRPWDIAGGALLIKEAGGLISDMQGGEDYLQQGDVVAGTPKVLKSLLQAFAPVLRGV